MNPRANITVDIRIRTRADMNTATPRFGSWTYHHVQPVRIYYMAASLVLRVITDADAYAETRALGVNALEKMCNNPPNKAALRAFVDRKAASVATDDERQVIAKTCASPPFGGFGGPNPSQRSDDPHDGSEPLKPVSAEAVWWECLQRIGSSVLGAFGLHQMPAPNTTVAATKMAFEWNDIVATLIGDLEGAALSGGASFAKTDWKVTNPEAPSWVMITRGQAATFDQFRRMWVVPYPEVALRVPREQNSCLDPFAVPLDAMERRGTVPLLIDDDFLKYLF